MLYKKWRKNSFGGQQIHRRGSSTTSLCLQTQSHLVIRSPNARTPQSTVTKNESSDNHPERLCGIAQVLATSYKYYILYTDICIHIRYTYPIYNHILYTSSTAQGGGGSFKNRKPIGEIGCCESGMAERIHWWTERCLRSPLFLSFSLTIYLPTNLSSMYLSIDLSISLSLSSNYLSIYLSVYLSTCLPVYLWCSVIQCNVV